MKGRKDHSPEFEAKVAPEAIREEMTLAEPSRKYGIHPTRIGTWKRAAIENMATAFTRRGGAPEQVSAAEIDKLHSKIGQLSVERDFFGRCRAPVARDARQEMVSKDHGLSVRRQCALLTLARSNLYYEPQGEGAENLGSMEIIDEQFLETPLYGSRQMARYMKRNNHQCGCHRMRRPMRIMGLQAICRGPNTGRKHQQHPIYPHLLRKLAITRPNQVWCSDITHIPVKNGFLYPVAIMDWATRKVLSWRLSDTLHASFCVEALEEPIAKYGKPGIMNTDSHTIGAGSRVVCLNTDRPFAGLVPLGLLVWSDPNRDRTDLCLSLDLSIIRERLAASFAPKVLRSTLPSVLDGVGLSPTEPAPRAMPMAISPDTSGTANRLQRNKGLCV